MNQDVKKETISVSSGIPWRVNDQIITVFYIEAREYQAIAVFCTDGVVSVEFTYIGNSGWRQVLTTLQGQTRRLPDQCLILLEFYPSFHKPKIFHGNTD